MDQNDKDQRPAQLDDLALIARIKQHKKESDQHLGEWLKEAEECYAFVAGEQWATDDKAKLLEMGRLPVVFNRVGPMVDAVAGSEVQNRQQVQYIPRQVGDVGVNEVLTGAADYIRDACDAEDEESEAFYDAVVCGIGCTETSLDYVSDPEGAVLIDRRDPLTVRWDPAAKKRNLTDRRWDLRFEWMDREEIQDKWPDRAEEIGASTDWGSSDQEGQLHDADMAWLYKRDATGYDDRAKKLRVIHHQEWELESFWVMLNPDTQQLQEIDKATLDTLSERLQVLGMPPLQSMRKQRKKYMQTFVCGDVVLERSACPCNQFTRAFIAAKRDRNQNTWFGIVRAMLDPQRWANKFFSQILHIINTNAKGGLMVEESATDNIGRLKEEWAKADSVVVLNEGAISQGKVIPKPLAQVPQDVNNMLQFSISSLRDVTGINLELLGMADRQQAGVLEAQRKQAALTVLAVLFDALRKYRKEQGRLLADFIRDYLSDGRLVRILGGDGVERYIPLIRDPKTAQYDVIVDEASTTVDRKAQTFQVLMQLMPALRDQGVPFGPELLEYLPLPNAMVEKWKQRIDQQQQQPKQPDPQMLIAQAKVQQAQAGAQKAGADAQVAMVEAQSAQAQAAMSMQGDAAKLQHEHAMHVMNMRHEEAMKAADMRMADMERRFNAQLQLMLQHMKGQTAIEVAEIGSGTTLQTAQIAAARQESAQVVPLGSGVPEQR
jgi:hypothetical protein